MWQEYKEAAAGCEQTFKTAEDILWYGHHLHPPNRAEDIEGWAQWIALDALFGLNRGPDSAMFKAQLAAVYAAGARKVGPQPLLSKVCHTPPDGAGKIWAVQRLGPFVGTGGFDWHFMSARDALSITKGLDLQPVSIDTLLSVPIDGSGELLGFPPIHNHHSHVFIPDDGPFRGSMLLAHQDSTCTGHEGWKCSMLHFPEEHGIILNGPRPLSLNILLNDVRPSGSKPLQFFFELAVRFSVGHARHPVQQWRVESPQPWGSNFATFLIPSAKPSLMWQSVRAPFSGRLLNIWVHAHITRGFNQLWLISMSPEDLGLNSLQFVQHNELYQCSPAQTPLLGVEAAQDMILSHMRAVNSGFDCIARRPNNFVSEKGDSQPVWECFDQAKEVYAGQPLTAITFFEAHEPADPAWNISWQHSHFQAFLEPSATMRKRSISMLEQDRFKIYYQFGDTGFEKDSIQESCSKTMRSWLGWATQTSVQLAGLIPACRSAKSVKCANLRAFQGLPPV